MPKLCTKCGAPRDTASSWCRVCKNAQVQAYRATPEGRAKHSAYQGTKPCKRCLTCGRKVKALEPTPHTG